MKGPEGPGRKGNQPQNESEADFHSRGVSENVEGVYGHRKLNMLKAFTANIMYEE